MASAAKQCCAAGACCESGTSVAALLNASWTKASQEYAALTAEQRKELGTRVGTIMARHATAKLLPETVNTLADGLQILVELETFLLKAVKEDPELSKNFSGEVAKAVEERCARMREVSEIMSKARAAMQAAGEPARAD